ncbi:hypothetical protein Leryth_014588 [Lithospermum erythrorhizon]|nr:hypothetical protein Leryth_014588 [Lithospermum erythrorhizon]
MMGELTWQVNKIIKSQRFGVVGEMVRVFSPALPYSCVLCLVSFLLFYFPAKIEKITPQKQPMQKTTLIDHQQLDYSTQSSYIRQIQNCWIIVVDRCSLQMVVAVDGGSCVAVFDRLVRNWRVRQVFFYLQET